MKNKSPAKVKAVKKVKEHIDPSNVKAKGKKALLKKKAFDSAKAKKQQSNNTPKQNGNIEKGSAKKEKKVANKVPLMNEASDDDDEVGKKQTAAETTKDKPNKGKKNKTPPQTLADNTPTPNKKAKSTVNVQTQEQKGKITKKLLKADGAKKKNKQKVMEGAPRQKVSLISTLAGLKHNKNIDHLREMLPIIISEIEHLEKQEQTNTRKRKMRLLKAYRNKAEAGDWEVGLVPQPKKRTGLKVPQEVLDMSMDDDEDNDQTWVEQLNKAAKEDEDDEEESEEEEDGDKEEKPSKAKKLNVVKQAEEKQASAQNEKKGPKKHRYVLFVGNLSYETTEEEIRKHFDKAGKIVDVRIGKDKGTNKSKGYCHLELDCEEAYQRALSMHHTQLNKRRLNVMVSQGKDAGAAPGGKKNTAKVKDMKLKGMAQKGQLAGSTKSSQKRSARRKKAAAAKAGAELGSAHE